MYSDVIREREELSEQIRALEELKKLGEIYGYDISKPAPRIPGKRSSGCTSAIWRLLRSRTARRCPWAVPPPSLTSTHSATWTDGTFTPKKQIQEFVDHFIMKLRLVKFARTPEYNELFSGDPTWVTESIGGVGIDGRHMVTKYVLPLPPHLTESGHRAGAEPDGAVVHAGCRRTSSDSVPRPPSSPRPSSMRTTT